MFFQGGGGEEKRVFGGSEDKSIVRSQRKDECIPETFASRCWHDPSVAVGCASFHVEAIGRLH